MVQNANWKVGFAEKCQLQRFVVVVVVTEVEMVGVTPFFLLRQKFWVSSQAIPLVGNEDPCTRKLLYSVCDLSVKNLCSRWVIDSRVLRCRIITFQASLLQDAEENASLASYTFQSRAYHRLSSLSIRGYEERFCAYFFLAHRSAVLRKFVLAWLIVGHRDHKMNAWMCSGFCKPLTTDAGKLDVETHSGLSRPARYTFASN